jgi:restriction system protein
MARRRTTSGSKLIPVLGPVLKAVRELGGSARPQEVYEEVAAALGLSEEQRSEVTPGGVLRHENQVAWARHFLVRAGLLDASKRGVWTLTEKGREAGDLSPAQALEVYKTARRRIAEESSEGRGPDPGESEVPGPPGADEPALPADHRERVIDVLQRLAPSGFERFCQRLLREAGFQNVVVTGRAGDGGIDGVGMLQVNALVSFKVLFQCKRYRNTVTPAEVRNFRGAMAGRADKGIILTTGGFTAEAKREAVRDGVPPIELVDAEKLVRMLEDLEIGLVPERAFRIDEEFFGSFDKVLGGVHDSD